MFLSSYTHIFREYYNLSVFHNFVGNIIISVVSHFLGNIITIVFFNTFVGNNIMII